jgi:tetrapyrrole methylase family protein/MazG family protein
MKKTKAQLFEEYMAVVQRLRAECPWDREQTHESIRPMLVEEAYEVLEAIDARDMDALKMELGDLLLHVALHSVMASEQRAFTVEEVIASSMEKLIRRHPHVFGTTKAGSAGEVKANWEKIKLSEGRTSILEGVPRELPSLLRAVRLQEKASKVGFDWSKKEEVWNKVEEELREFRSAEESGNTSAAEHEFGDLLFAMVNYARFIHVNPEFALSKACNKFSQRFRRIEKELNKQGKTFEETTLEEMDAIWNEQKQHEQP